MHVPLSPREPGVSPDPPALGPGALVGGYRVVRPLGQGGMGRVYLAADERLDRNVALKVLPPEDADEEARARFLREAQALARVHHKNVVQVFASGADGDVAWMALEYVEGDPLGALLGAGIDEELALSLCAQAARGLAAVHAVDVVHRDVKPDNLLLDTDAVVRVLDFGVALFVDAGRGGFTTQKGVAVGTPHFMAPEQARGGALDARVDAWGLGATLYALLVGRPPFFVRDDESDLDILARVLRERAPDPRVARPLVSAATASVVRRLLEPDAAARFADMSAIADELDAIADALAAGDEPSALDDSASSSAPFLRAASSSAASSSAASSSAASDSASSLAAVHDGPARAPPVTGGASSDSSSPDGPPRWLAALGVVSVAGLFLLLGALIGPVVARAPADAGVLVSAPQKIDPSPPRHALAGPGEGEPEGRIVEPSSSNAAFGGADGGVAARGDDPMSAEARAASIVKHPEANLQALKVLVDDDTPLGRATLALVVADPGEAGDLALSVIAAKGARQHVPLVGSALKSTRAARALTAIGVLEELKSEAALALLNDAARDHPNPNVRKRAQAASAALFRVE